METTIMSRIVVISYRLCLSFIIFLFLRGWAWWLVGGLGFRRNGKGSGHYYNGPNGLYEVCASSLRLILICFWGGGWRGLVFRRNGKENGNYYKWLYRVYFFGWVGFRV